MNKNQTFMFYGAAAACGILILTAFFGPVIILSLLSIAVGASLGHLTYLILEDK